MTNCIKNRINRGKIYITLFILAFSISCLYSEEEPYLVDITPGTPPTPVISTNLDTIDFPEVVDSLEVKYEVEVDLGEFIWTTFLLSDSIIFDSDSADYNFWLVHDMASDSGYNKLTMNVYYSTNTGSLADIIGIEAFKETKYYNIWFDGRY